MYVEKLYLQNIKCFEDTEFSFLKEGGTPAKWVTLLGENATGKTTTLKSIAMSTPDDYGVVSPFNFGHKIADNFISPDYKMISDIRHKGITQKNTFDINQTVQIDIYKIYPLFSCGYGSFRRLSDQTTPISPRMPDLASPYYSLFEDNFPLAVFEQWIIWIDYQVARGIKKYNPLKEKGINAINELLPDNVYFDKINNEGNVLFLVNNRSIPISGLSDGYRSVLALGGDLIWRLLNAFPDSEDPMSEEGVVLIDELDIHLHPRWQARIAQKLRSAFPNIQFIVATHSPLVAMGAYWNGETGELRDDVLTLKLEINDGKASVQRIDDDLAAMDINRALESPAFGMVAPRPPEVEKKIDRHDALIAKHDRTDAEEVEFQALRAFMAEARPIGGKPEPGSFQAKLEAYLSESLP
jgi:AAA domain, putative AbiEii toxin, Type IV TA system